MCRYTLQDDQWERIKVLLMTPFFGGGLCRYRVAYRREIFPNGLGTLRPFIHAIRDGAKKSMGKTSLPSVH